ncbi:MAG: hypothetical protein V1886_04030, partial [archaeon]
MQKKGVFILDSNGQVTLFTIIAIVVVSAVALLFFLKPGMSIAPKTTEPQAYIEKCMKDAGTEALSLLIKHGGALNPKAYVTYGGEKISYLCYTSDYYSKCVNQQPLLKYNIESEITGYSLPKLQQCISELKVQLEKKGYSVTTGNLQLQATLQPKKV